MQPADDGANLDDTSLVTFEGKHGSKLRTDRPDVKRAFAQLGQAWPAGIRRRDDADDVKQALLGAHAAGLLQLTTHEPAIAKTGEVSTLARAQIARGDDAVTNLKHEHIPVTDEGRRAIATNTLSETDLERLGDLALLTRPRREAAAPREASPAS